MFMQFSKAMKKAGPVPESIGNESEPDRNWYEVGSHMMAMCLAEWFDHAGFPGRHLGKVQWLSGFIAARVEHYFEFTVAGGVSAHSMALVHTQDCHGLFDPDFGMASISIHSRKGNRQCIAFLPVSGELSVSVLRWVPSPHSIQIKKTISGKHSAGVMGL